MLTIAINYEKNTVTAELYGDGFVKPIVAKLKGIGYSRDSSAVARVLNEAGIKLPKRVKCVAYDGEFIEGVGMTSIIAPLLAAGFAVIQRETKNGKVIVIFKKSEIKNGFYN